MLLRIVRTRGKNFIPIGRGKFQRRVEDAAMLIGTRYRRVSRGAKWGGSRLA
jgi:hypothetical protein